eukprot:COSAG06_NODE_40214_length_404_cov_0.645902_1_plen_53_part_01
MTAGHASISDLSTSLSSGFVPQLVSQRVVGPKSQVLIGSQSVIQETAPKPSQI